MVMSFKVLVIVPCGSSKIWGKFPKSKATIAEEAYIGHPFKVNRTFAEKFADKWVILSAKYGFMDPDFPLRENYDVSFNDLATDPISLSELKAQVKRKGLESYEFVIALGGENYIEIVRELFKGAAKVIAPAEGLPMGKAMSFIKSLTKLDKAQMLKKIL